MMVSLLVVLMQPVFAGGKDKSNWATTYQWCANAAPEYLFDASFDEWMDACMSGKGKKKKSRVP